MTPARLRPRRGHEADLRWSRRGESRARVRRTLVYQLQTERLRLVALAADTPELMIDRVETVKTYLDADWAPEWPGDFLLDILRQRRPLSPSNEPFGVWAIIEKSTSTVIGDIGFKGPPDENRCLEMGYRIVAQARGVGYATEAARALIAFVRELDGVEWVTAECDPDNEASLRVLSRVGFRETGRSLEAISWSLRVTHRDVTEGPDNSER